MIHGKQEPMLYRGIDHLYIYTSLCEPINVGGVERPLLKNIWIDGDKRNYSHGEIINVVIQNPIYIPVNATTINSIEINIRDDAGQFIPFPREAVTSLTLHFKKNG